MVHGGEIGGFGGGYRSSPRGGRGGRGSGWAVSGPASSLRALSCPEPPGAP
jgi:hypothetical protein